MNPPRNETDICNSLRIPDAVKDLPTFDGNPRLLYDFISNVEEILSFILDVSGTNYANIILRAIRNKIVGQASEILNMYGTSLDWSEIKNNLTTHFSDKRNETSLIRDLHQLRQNGRTVEEFYSKIIEIFSTMMNYIRVHELHPNVIKAKETLFEEMCLNTFLSGLREPLGSTIRAMRPSKLPDALKFCLQEQNSIYFQNRQQSRPPTFSNYNPIQSYQQRQPSSRTLPTSFRQHFTNPQYRQTFNRQPYFGNVSYDHQPFFNQTTNYPQPSSIWANYNRPRTSFPSQANTNFQPASVPPAEPMDTYSGRTNSRKFNNSSRGNSSKNLKNLQYGIK